MTTTFPAQPWTEGDVFVNDTTGVSYTYSGGKWLASGGPEVEGQYLPLTGGELTGDLDVNGTLQVKGDDALYIRNHSSVLQIKPNELINGAILANAMYDPQNGYLKDYLPLTGGQLTGQLTIKKSTQVALDIVGDNNQSQIKFWSSGAVALQNYTNFKDNELVTKKYVDDKVVSPSVGRRFKYALGTRVDDGCFAIGDYEILFSWVDLNGVIRKMPDGPDFAWTNFAKMTIWNAEGALWYAAELSKGTNWSSTMFRWYKDSVKLDRGLVVDEEYEITIEGYW